MTYITYCPTCWDSESTKAADNACSTCGAELEQMAKAELLLE
jgi:hypothetical protein